MRRAISDKVQYVHRARKRRVLAADWNRGGLDDSILQDNYAWGMGPKMSSRRLLRDSS